MNFKMRILVTGASGKTGLAVIHALAEKDPSVIIRAFVHRERQCDIVREYGAAETITGDLTNPADIHRALENVDAVYHICPTAEENEYEIGQLVYTAAAEAGVKLFVYHSVLHSIFSDLPHHEKKHRLEMLITEGSLPYVILQPAALMQNLMNSREKILNEGVLMQRFFAGEDVRMNLVDLGDVAEAAAKVLTESGHEFATYELCGPENLTEADIITALAKAVGKPVESRFIPDEMFAGQMRKAGKSETYISTLLTMFRHYQKQGFMGNSGVLQSLLGRKPTTLEEYLHKEFVRDNL